MGNGGRAAIAALAFCGGVTLAGTNAAGAAVTEDMFQANTTGELIALCSADKSDPMYTPAINFCHGFAVGTYRAVVAEDAAHRVKLFCPDTAMSRNDAIAAFITWSGTHQEVLTMTPTEGALHYLSERFPCPQPSSTPARHRRHS